MKQSKNCKKILYVISGVDYALGFEWLEKYLDRAKYDPHFIFLAAAEPALHKMFLQKGVDSAWIPCSSKKDYPGVFLRLCKFMILKRPDIVHAHLLDANLLAIPAAWLTRVPARIYTRHHSTYHFDYHPHMVRVDKMINSLCTRIASISENVTNVLVKQEGVDKHKVMLVNHGFELDRFIQVDEKTVSLLRARYNPGGKHPVIGVISRFTEWKGVQYIIEAFAGVLQKYPDALLLMANAKGDYEAELDSLLSGLPGRSWLKIPFERDLYALYRLMDVFVHVPVDEKAEAFGQVYVEALAAGIPSVVTLSGIAREFIRHKEEAWTVPFKNSEAVSEGIIALLSDTTLKNHIIATGRKTVLQRFGVENMMAALDKIYEA